MSWKIPRLENIYESRKCGLEAAFGGIKNSRLHIDVALVQVTPPDAFGKCSLGVSAETVRAAVEHAGYMEHVPARLTAHKCHGLRVCPDSRIDRIVCASVEQDALICTDQDGVDAELLGNLIEYLLVRFPRSGPLSHGS